MSDHKHHKDTTAPEAKWQHSHSFDSGNRSGETKTRWAVILTAVMMVAEIAAGWLYNSMALLADGWHMSSHALALGLSLLAYAAARRFASDKRFTFGTWKIEILGGYTSAVMLVGVAGLMFLQSIERLVTPSPIHYDQAILVAAIGLAVNVVCAVLLNDGHDHHHHHDHERHDHHHHHSHGNHDLNLRSAYLHVIADAATSLLAIAALFGGKLFGFTWLDPVMGIVGAILVSGWAVGLLKDTGRVLLDADMDAPVVEEIREVIRDCAPDARIADLHVWKVGRGKFSCILSLVIDQQKHPHCTPDYFRQHLGIHEEIVHVTVEINHYVEAGQPLLTPVSLSGSM